MEVAKVIEQFNLSVALKSFHGPFLERRLNGLKTILDLLTVASTKTDIKSVWHTLADVLTWVSENKVIEEIYRDPNQSPAIIQKSTDLLKFMARDYSLKIHHFDALWDAAMQALELKYQDTALTIFKVIFVWPLSCCLRMQG